jgi:8-oxo-dGTP diphosphatase
VYDVTDLRCTLDPPDQQAVAGDDATDVVLADAATLAGLACTPRLVETLRGWGVLPG